MLDLRALLKTSELILNQSEGWFHAKKYCLPFIQKDKINRGNCVQNLPSEDLRSSVPASGPRRVVVVAALGLEWSTPKFTF